MKQLRCRIYVKQQGGHVHLRVFSNMVPVELHDRDVTLACAGTLTFSVEEWPELCGRLRDGGGFEIVEEWA